MKNIFLILLTMLGINACANAQNKTYTDMDVKEFSNFLTSGENIQLLDVRTPEEYSAGHIEGAKNIDWFNDGFLKIALKSLDKSKPVAVYCRSGKRSAEASHALAKQGYKVTNLEGGILAWENDKKPIIR